MAAEKRNIPRLTLRAAIEPATFNEEARTVDVTWTTGARVRRGGFWTDPYYEELSLAPEHVRLGRLNGGTAPMLDAHNGAGLSGVLGVVVADSVKLQKKRGTAKVRFATAAVNPNAEAVFQGVKEGVICNVSVGYDVHRYEEIPGKKGDLPIRRAVDWEPFEISPVPMGADADSHFRAEDTQLHPCEFVEANPDEETRTMENEIETKTTATPASPVAAPAPETRSEPAKPVLTEADVQRAAERAAAVAVEAERVRTAEIRSAAKAAELSDEFADEHIKSNTSADAFRSLAFKEMAKRKNITGSGGIAVVAGEDSRDKWLRGASDWLVQRAGVAHTVVEAAKKHGETVRVEPGEFRGLSLVEIARDALERAGVKTRGMDRKTMVGLALTKRQGYGTTSDFATLLENTMHKVLLASYDTTPDTWSLFCSTGVVNDFRPHYRYRRGALSKLETVNEHGEFKTKSISDGAKESITAVTKGNIIALTRQMIVNDDMGAFSQLATEIGRAARLTIESDVYALLAENSGLGPDMTDASPLFDDTAHSNEGTGSTLTVAGLDADRVVMASQQDMNSNEYLDLRPAILLVPVGLGGQARVINGAEFDTDAVAASSTNKFMVPNSVRGLFRTIVDTARLTGTRRYLFADPAVAPTIEVAFLDGQSAPYLETKEGWEIDGAEWKVRLDYAVDAVGYQGAVTNAGTE